VDLIEAFAEQIMGTFDVSKFVSTATAENGTAKFIPYHQGAAPSDSKTLSRLRAIGLEQLASFIESLLATKANNALVMRLAFKIVINANLIDR